jgi:hypothetical protein
VQIAALGAQHVGELTLEASAATGQHRAAIEICELVERVIGRAQQLLELVAADGRDRRGDGGQESGHWCSQREVLRLGEMVSTPACAIIAGMAGPNHHSAGQRTAVVGAILDGGMSARQAADAAGRGELPGVEAFPVSESTARGWASEARRDEPARRDARADGPGDRQTEDELDATERRLRRILRAEGERLEGQEEPNLERARWLARVAREVDALTRQRRRGHRRVPDADGNDAPAGGFIDGLAASAAKAEARNGDETVRRLVAQERAANGK